MRKNAKYHSSLIPYFHIRSGKLICFVFKKL